MGIRSEVLEQSIRSDDRPLGKDDPFTLSERMNQLSPRDGLPERFEFAMNLEFSLGVKLNESVDKFGGQHGRDGLAHVEMEGRGGEMAMAKEVLENGDLGSGLD